MIASANTVRLPARPPVSRQTTVKNPLAELSHKRDLVRTTLIPGRQLGNYTLRQFIGAGGFGDVWQAEGEAGEAVAVKIDPYTTPGEHFLLSQLIQHGNHPNLVGYFGGGVMEENFHFKAIEFVPGRTLLDAISADGALSQLYALVILRKAAAGLGYLHRCGLIHNDIKPENIMVTEDLAVKLIDYGLVTNYPVRVTGGTDLYKSPEQRRQGEVAPPSDIFGLGIVFYMLLSGEHPYEHGISGAGELHVKAIIDNMERGKLTPDIRKYPPSIRFILERMLAENPADRFGSTEEVIQAVDDALLAD